MYTSHVGKSVNEGAKNTDNDSSDTTKTVADVSVPRERDVVLGSEDAPVTVVIYGDFECPYCKNLKDGSEKIIREQYVNTGKVRLIHRDFPLSFHENALPASEAAECAKDQGKFWEYRDTLYDRQDKLGSLNYITLAGELGLDKDKFKECYDSHKYRPNIQKAFDEGVALGVSGTPATFVNGIKIVGAQPFENTSGMTGATPFKPVIEAALKEADNN